MLVLAGADGVFAALVVVAVRVVPIMPMGTAVPFSVLAGFFLALSFWARLRTRFLTGEDERVRSSVALVSASVAVAIAWLAMLPLADHARSLDPTVLAIPSFLGAYALAAVVIDGIARRRVTGKRMLLGLAGIAAIAMLPWATSITWLPTKYVVIGSMVVLLLVLMP